MASLKIIKMEKNFLPITKKEIDRLGWDSVDVIIVSGDAYVDHPSFGHAVIARVVESCGLRVAVLPQPNWEDDLRDFKKFGKPNLFFGVSAGNMDSMINRYTANKRLRSDDSYTPGDKSGFRPNYSTITYSNIIKSLYPDVPVIIGGIEASMRRNTHYDYWSDKVMKPILCDSKADILIYGMGEKPTVDLIEYIRKNGKSSILTKNIELNKLIKIPQISFIVDDISSLNKEDYILLSSFEESSNNKQKFAENYKIIEQECDKYESKILVEKVGDKYVVINKKNLPMTTEELDKVYELPFTRLPHPKYKKRGEVPAFEMIKNSVNIHRGCFGACSFCTISAHQGKFITSRSEESILKEVKTIVQQEGFNGTISDLGGPSANMYKMGGINFEICKKCVRSSCIYPNICNNLNFDHSPLIDLYKKVSKVKGVKNIFIGSGIRYDMFFPKNKELEKKYKTKEYATQIIKYHTGGRLKVAPEHSSKDVLDLIRKPSFNTFTKFRKFFYDVCKQNNLKYQLIPYFISSLPGCTLNDMNNLMLDIKKINYRPQQVQSFTPTPMTLSTTMYYTGINPYTLEKVYSAKTITEKKNQNIFFFWYKKENFKRIKKLQLNLNRNI